jgi:uncharacterized protein YbcI
MSDTQPDTDLGHRPLNAVSTALVALHKEQFGRGPTRARTNFAGDDTLVCIMFDALLPAERAMVEMGEATRVRESRTWFQVATAKRFIDTVETIINRTVVAFSSASDPEKGVVMEIFVLEPKASQELHPPQPITPGHGQPPVPSAAPSLG